MTKYISTKGNQYMNKQHWNDLSKAEQAQLIVDGLETGSGRHSKPINLGKHSTHTLKVINVKAPHFAKLVCADCNKNIAWLSREQAKQLRT
jgi:hypothetical protein